VTETETGGGPAGGGGSAAAPLPRFPLVGGDAALDFTNTVGDHASDQPWEWLRGYPALVAWGRQAGLLTEDAARRLLAAADRDPAAAAAALEGAKAVRETIFRIFAAVAAGRSPAPTDLTAFNAALAQAFARLRVAPADGAVVWAWEASHADLAGPLWPIVRAAADLLTSDRAALVRQCAGAGCGWLFLDTSRRRNRRWCRMTDCGNRAKAQRHRARSKASSEPTAGTLLVDGTAAPEVNVEAVVDRLRRHGLRA
jgi:predicted RNA-binding Zn ribbon-like protein